MLDRIAANLARQGIDVSKTSIDWKKIFEEERPNAETVGPSPAGPGCHRAPGDTGSNRRRNSTTSLRRWPTGAESRLRRLRAQFEKDQRLQAFRMFLLQNKALDFIYRNATISEG